MWRSIHSMCAASWLRRPSGVCSCTREKTGSAHSRYGPTRGMPTAGAESFWLRTDLDCLNPNAPVEVAALAVEVAEVDAQVAEEAEAQEAVELVVGERVGAEALAGQAVKAVPEAQEVPVERAARAAQEEPVEEPPGVAEALGIRMPTIRTTCLRNRGRSFRNFHPLPRRTSRFLRLSRRERADSPSSTPTTCWGAWRRSGGSRTSFIFWATCHSSPLKEVATL